MTRGATYHGVVTPLSGLNPATRANRALKAIRHAAATGVGIVEEATEAATGKQDGRKQRWQQHKQQRRAELVDGTLAAIRELGADAGMDEIAAQIGVSKTVLYRYFADKSDLTTSAMLRFVQVSLLPRLADALEDKGDDVVEYDMVRTAITVYVQTVAEEPAIYAFITTGGSTEGTTNSETLIAQIVEFAMRLRMDEYGIDSEGATVWAHGIVGGIQLATHSWVSGGELPADRVIDYLTMMVWSSIVGIFRYEGSADAFRAADHPFPPADRTRHD